MPQTIRKRIEACEVFLGAVSSLENPAANKLVLEAASVVKGLFNRVVRADQLDWLTVCRQLGCASHRISDVIEKEIATFRSAVKDGDREAWLTART